MTNDKHQVIHETIFKIYLYESPSLPPIIETIHLSPTSSSREIWKIYQNYKKERRYKLYELLRIDIRRQTKKEATEIIEKSQVILDRWDNS
jgi:hypothetical protein